MDKTTAHLVDFALALDMANLPADAVAAAKCSLVDGFACAIAAFPSEPAALARRIARRQSGSRPAASVWGCGWTTSPEMAAFANGLMLRQLDLSDSYRQLSGGHPSDVISAILAVADAEAASGAAVVTAMVAAYEVYCGCCDAVDLNSAGWDQPVYGVVASAIGAGLVLGLDRVQLGHAVAMALAPGPALIQTRRGNLSAWKNAAGANAAKAGVFAATLARDGFTGPQAIFEGRHGLFDAVGRFDWRLPAAAGEPFRVTRVNFKNFPLCYHGQASTWAALDLHRQVDIRDIESIRIEVPLATRNMMADDPSKWAPRTPETADHSLPYVVAAALLDGQVEADSFDPSRLEDGRLQALMRMTLVEAADDLTARSPASAPARVTVQLKDGTQRLAEVRSALGHADNPLGDDGVRAKFLRLTQPVCGQAVAERFLAALLAVDTAADIRTVLALIAGTERPVPALASH